MTIERAYELLQDLNGMTKEEAIEVLELHLIEFTHDFGWNRTTIKAMEIAIKALGEPERKTGRWIDITNDESLAIELKCSECGFELINWAKMNYCPNCGAKMDGESE